MAAKKDDKKQDADEGEAKPSKLPLIMLVLLVLNMGGTGFVAFMALNPLPPPPPPEEERGPEEDPTIVWGPTVEMDPFVVNLNEPTSSRYLRTQIKMEMIDQKAADRFGRAVPVIRNELLAYLSSLTVEDTLGMEAKERIRTDLVSKITTTLGEDQVKRLFFAEFVVQ